MTRSNRKSSDTLNTSHPKKSKHSLQTQNYLEIGVSIVKETSQEGSENSKGQSNSKAQESNSKAQESISTQKNHIRVVKKLARPKLPNAIVNFGESLTQNKH